MMRLRFRQFIFCWFLAFFAGTSTAQEATQASLPEQVYYESAIVVFPQAIRFQVVVDVPAIQIAFITLQISPPDGEPILININPFTATITEPFTDLTVQWDVPPTMPPPLFSEISYQWRIITQRDQVIMFDRQVVFADTRAQWEQNEDASGRLNLTFPIGLVEAGRLRTSLRDYFDLLEQTSRQPISLRLLLYGDGLRPGCDRDLSGQPVVRYQDGPEIAEVPCNLELAEAIFRRSGYTVLEITSRSALERAIWDLAFDAAYNRAWDASDVPLWFRQGLRDWYRPISKIGYLGTAQNASRTDALIPLGLLDDTPTAPNQRAIWEAQSYGLVLFIAEQGGVDALYEIARGLGSDMTLDELVRQTIGVSLSALQRDWESWIFTRSAESAYAFIPYGGPTPTPPPPTNTLTATPSFTPTDTLTPTVTGVLSPTPSNTPTPTRTPTPTITPRPAVSFVIGATPTRAPTAEEAPSTPLNQTQLLVIGVGVVLLAFLALLYYLFGRQE